MEGKKKELWRVVLAIISVIFIIFMWVKKDIAAIYSTVPKEHLASIIITTIAVTLIKVIGITVVILLIKWIVSKIKNKEK